MPPAVVHTPIATAPAGKPLTITAEVRSPSGVKWVRVRYRSVTQFEDFQTLPMLPTGKKDQYQAVIPAEQVVTQWDFMYLIEVMDNQGHGRIYPDLNKETPYIVVRLVRARNAIDFQGRGCHESLSVTPPLRATLISTNGGAARILDS